VKVGYNITALASPAPVSLIQPLSLFTINLFIFFASFWASSSFCVNKKKGYKQITATCIHNGNNKSNQESNKRKGMTSFVLFHSSSSLAD